MLGSIERLEVRSLLSVTVTNIGAVQDKTSATSISITPATAVPVDNTIIITAAVEAPFATLFSATDSEGNSYSLDAVKSNDSSVTTAILSAQVMTAFPTGDTITVSVDQAPSARAVSVL